MSAKTIVEPRLRFADLVERKIVANRQSLKNWIDREGFPVGKRLGSNSRSWTESEVQRWIDGRTSDLKPSPNRQRIRKGGRQRKHAADHATA
ncbi:MAG TPA: hypothetical protein VIR04_08955 [Paralcaligenes sp.]|jgi:predicted DNA-binding transcriptional regulator AlpA